MKTAMLLSLALAVSVQANTIDLTTTDPVTFAHGQDLRIQFSVWNYAANNPGTSPYPTSVGLQVFAASPIGVAASSMQGATTQYLPDFLLQGTLESLDGSASVALDSPAAALMGLASGSLVVTPATLYGSSAGSAAALIDARVTLSLALSEQIFGPDVSSRQSSAIIVLRNLGADITIGAAGLALRNAISENVSGMGNVQTSGIANRATLVPVPEPGTMILTLVLVLAFGVVMWRRV